MKIVLIMLDVVGRMHRAGVRILAGSDAPWLVVPGFSLHDELVLLVKAGFTPADALRAATSDSAEFLGLQNSLGTVRPASSQIWCCSPPIRWKIFGTRKKSAEFFCKAAI